MWLLNSITKLAGVSYAADSLKNVVLTLESIYRPVIAKRSSQIFNSKQNQLYRKGYFTQIAVNHHPAIAGVANHYATSHKLLPANFLHCCLYFGAGGPGESLSAPTGRAWILT